MPEVRLGPHQSGTLGVGVDLIVAGAADAARLGRRAGMGSARAPQPLRPCCNQVLAQPIHSESLTVGPC